RLTLSFRKGSRFFTGTPFLLSASFSVLLFGRFPLENRTCLSGHGRRQTRGRMGLLGRQWSRAQPASAGVVAPIPSRQRVHPHSTARVRRVDELLVPDVDPHVADSSSTAKEHQVAGAKIVSGYGYAAPYLLG